MVNTVIQYLKMCFPAAGYLDVLIFVTSELSDPITAMIAALIGPRRFVTVLIQSRAGDRGAI